MLFAAPGLKSAPALPSEGTVFKIAAYYTISPY